MHLPVVIAPGGEKLSKQTGAAAVDARRAGELAWRILADLGQAPPREFRGASPCGTLGLGRRPLASAATCGDPQHTRTMNTLAAVQKSIILGALQHAHPSQARATRRP
jgi:hypothetical protein